MERARRDWGHWSPNEKAVAVALVTILAVFTAVWAIVLYEPPTGPGLCGPCPGREAIYMYSSAMNSPTNMTLELIDTGAAGITLVAYYVWSGTGATFSHSNWTGPTLQPNNVVDVNILIDGSTFSFQHGSLYSVKVISARNNQFVFTVQV